MGRGGGQVVSVLAVSSTIRVRIPLTPTVFSVKLVFEKNENKQKRLVLAHLKKTALLTVPQQNQLIYDKCLQFSL